MEKVHPRRQYLAYEKTIQQRTIALREICLGLNIIIVTNLAIFPHLVLNHQRIQECPYREKRSSIRHSLYFTKPEKKRGNVPSHLVTSIVVQNLTISGSCTLQAVIDSCSPFNLIS